MVYVEDVVCVVIVVEIRCGVDLVGWVLWVIFFLFVVEYSLVGVFMFIFVGFLVF